MVLFSLQQNAGMTGVWWESHSPVFPPKQKTCLAKIKMGVPVLQNAQHYSSSSCQENRGCWITCYGGGQCLSNCSCHKLVALHCLGEVKCFTTFLLPFSSFRSVLYCIQTSLNQKVFLIPLFFWTFCLEWFSFLIVGQKYRSFRFFPLMIAFNRLD